MMMVRQLRWVANAILLLALATTSYVVTDRLRGPAGTPAPPAPTTDRQPARSGGEEDGRGRTFEDVAPVALVGSLLLVGGLFLLTLIVPTAGERRRFAHGQEM